MAAVRNAERDVRPCRLRAPGASLAAIRGSESGHALGGIFRVLTGRPGRRERPLTLTEPAAPVLAPGGVGDAVLRIDAVPKVTGQFDYASDLRRDGMLWGATARSPVPAARIKSIEVRAALRSPGVRAVLLAADVPGKNRFGLNFDDQPVLADTVIRFAGEPLAVVAADSREARTCGSAPDQR